MFAIDGVKLPSNASKARSGSRADFAREAAKLEAAALAMLARHRANDTLLSEAGLDAKATQLIKRMEAEARERRDWLKANPDDRKGSKGNIRKSNRTDNQSAKMATSMGVIQGYTGIAAVDDLHRIIIAEQAHDPAAGTFMCPAGNALYQNGMNCIHNGLIAVKFQGALRDCVPCTRRDRFLRMPAKTQTRQVCFFRGRADPTALRPSDRMKQALDSARGRELYGGRFATVEPVFGNLHHNKRLNRFTLRGRKKVDGQSKLYCLGHNIEKLAHHGYGQ
jgi:hypothetical protein